MSRSSELTHLFRAMKAPAAASALPKLAERAREEERSDERFAEPGCRPRSLARVLRRPAADPRCPVPGAQDLEEFDFTSNAGQEAVTSTAASSTLHAKDNVILLGRRDRQDTSEHRLGIAQPGWTAGPVRTATKGRAARRRATPRPPRRRARRLERIRCWSVTRAHPFDRRPRACVLPSPAATSARR